MANEYGFKFEIKGEVFVTQKSKAGADVVAAYTEAAEIRTKIQAELLDIPATFTIGEPVATSRRAAEPGDKPAPPAEDGPTPEMDLPSRRAKAKE